MIADLVREGLAQVPESARNGELEAVALLTADDLDGLADEPNAEQLEIAIAGAVFHAREAIRRLTSASEYRPLAALLGCALIGLAHPDEEPDGG